MDIFSKKLNEYISAIGINQLILFSIFNCKKLIPSYRLFSRVEAWGNPLVFDNLIENATVHLVNSKDNQSFETFESALMENFPNLDDFQSEIASYAFDTSCAISELLQYLINGDKKHIIANSQCCLNTVDMFIQQKENITYVKDINALNKLIDQDKFMINEKARQLALLNELKRFDVIDQNTIKLLDNLNDSFGDIIDYKFFL